MSSTWARLPASSSSDEVQSQPQPDEVAVALMVTGEAEQTEETEESAPPTGVCREVLVMLHFARKPTQLLYLATWLCLVALLLYVLYQMVAVGELWTVLLVLLVLFVVKVLRPDIPPGW